MNAKTLGFLAVLVGFGALNVEVLRVHGYLGFAELILANQATIALFVDLAIALTMVAAWMRRDATQYGLPFWPYFVLTMVLGSIGTLAYFVHRSLREERGRLVAVAEA
jgi:Terpene cyclase DEP1